MSVWTALRNGFHEHVKRPLRRGGLQPPVCRKLDFFTYVLRTAVDSSKLLGELSDVDLLLPTNNPLSKAIETELIKQAPTNNYRIIMIDMGDSNRSDTHHIASVTITVLNYLALPVLTGIIANVATGWRKAKGARSGPRITLEFKREDQHLQMVFDGGVSVKQLEKLLKSKDFSRWLS